jgi:hypothetical protein
MASAQSLTRAPWDPANSLLEEVRCQVTAQSVDTPAGPRLALTVRTASATVTVFLAKGNALMAADKIRGEAGKLPGVALAEAFAEV